MKPKLLIATDSFLPRWDGVSRFLSEILPAIKDSYDITVLAPDFKGEYKEIENVKVIRLRVHEFRIGDYNPPRIVYKSINQFVKDADLVWTQTIGPIGAATIFIAKRLKKTTIAYMHSIEWELVSKSISRNRLIGWWTHLIVKIIAWFLYNKCDIIMVPSLQTAELLTWQGIKTKKTVVQLGVDVHKFIPSTNKKQSKKNLGLAEDGIVIGFVGRIGFEKDLLTLYRAFIRLERTYQNIRLFIVGEGRKELKELFGRRKSIILSGAVNNVVPYLQAMDIYVLPSLTETSSLSTMEAMSTCLPVVCTPVGVVKEYIRDGKNGLLFPKQNSYVLSKKLEFLIKNPEMRSALGEEARRTIVEKFSWEKTVYKIKRVLELYS
ncbi:glycosyltransferase family 4 protein [Candidatus Woesearchaeota archaeon]|nr:glycosyltransferase family 4 protein [Candidatus Woesearchaeota archaeon]